MFYCEGNEKNKKRILKIINNLYPQIKDLRKIGSAGLETAGWQLAGEKVIGPVKLTLGMWQPVCCWLKKQEEKLQILKAAAGRPLRAICFLPIKLFIIKLLN